MGNRLKGLGMAILLIAMASPLMAQEVVVLSGLDETIAWFEAQVFWGMRNMPNSSRCTGDHGGHQRALAEKRQ